MQLSRRRWSIKHGMFALGLCALWGAFDANADRCGCPEYCCPPKRVPSVPSVYEPVQRAIVLWNGQEELLFLATDLGHTESAEMLEMITLPAVPTARLGELAMFSRLVTLAANYQALQGFSLPSAPVGRMSDLQVLPASELVHYGVQRPPAPDSLIPKPHTLPECGKFVQGLKRRGFEWIVLDKVQLTNEVQSLPPVEYRFKSSQLFYPLELSAQNQGETRIELAVITHQKLTHFSETIHPVERLSTFVLQSRDLQQLSRDWAAFMGPRPVTVEHLRMSGDIRKMTRDLWAH